MGGGQPRSQEVFVCSVCVCVGQGGGRGGREGNYTYTTYHIISYHMIFSLNTLGKLELYKPLFLSFSDAVLLLQ